MEGLTLPGLQGKSSKPSSNGLTGVFHGKRQKGERTFLYKVHHTAGRVFRHHRVPSRALEKGVEGVMWGHVLTSQVPASLVFFQKCNTDKSYSSTPVIPILYIKLLPTLLLGGKFCALEIYVPNLYTKE